MAQVDFTLRSNQAAGGSCIVNLLLPQWWSPAIYQRAPIISLPIASLGGALINHQLVLLIEAKRRGK